MVILKDQNDLQDAPPSYDEVTSRPSPWSNDRKGNVSPIPNEPQPSSAGAGPSSPSYQSKAGSSQKPWFSWFTEKDSRKQVKSTIQSLIRDVVKEPTTPAAASVLQSCADACQARGLSFQSIMCEKFIEGHSPIYWAIVKRSAVANQDGNVYQDVNLLDILLSIPLDGSARTEAYLACLVISDNLLFQRLRHEEAHKASPHEILLGSVPDDTVAILDGDPDIGAFRLNWRIASFQQRMRVVGSISIEVVARGRLWSICFMTLNTDINGIRAGTWAVCISLLSPSSSSNIYAQLSIIDPTQQYPGPVNSVGDQGATSSLSSSSPSTSNILPWKTNNRNTSKPPITLKFDTRSNALNPIPLWSPDVDVRQYIQSQYHRSLVMSLDSHWNGHSLQFDGCTYLDSEGSLNVILDASLTKPASESDCIIS